MRYVRPAIVQRERIEGLLDAAQSNPPDVLDSDVHAKEHIVPVAWAGETVAYTRPGISDREPLGALLADAAPSDKVILPSDVHAKDRIVPVRW